jgi:hypothetical protein
MSLQGSKQVCVHAFYGSFSLFKTMCGMTQSSLVGKKLLFHSHYWLLVENVSFLRNKRKEVAERLKVKEKSQKKGKNR